MVLFCTCINFALKNYFSQLQSDSSSCWSSLRECKVIMCVLERVVEFLYVILQWWSGWWYTREGQQEKVSCVEKVRLVVVSV